MGSWRPNPGAMNLEDPMATDREQTPFRSPYFESIGAARRFLRGYCVPRVIVRVSRGFGIVHPARAKRFGMAVVS